MKERASPAAPENGSETPPVTPGMAALLLGGNGGPNGQVASEENAVALLRRKRLVQISMFVADLLLISLVMRLAFVSEGHFGVFEILLGILALSIGAWLSCLAIWMK